MRTTRIAGRRFLRPTVVILSNERDISVDWVVRLLRAEHVAYARLNTERMLDWTLVLDPLEGHAELRGSDHVLDGTQVRSVWFRRPDPPRLPGVVEPREEEVVRAQWRVAIRGLAHVLGARWVNHPDRNDDAEQKLLQLRLAREVGFDVPATLVTSDVDSVRDFAVNHDGVVVKGLDAPYIEEAEGNGRFVFTTRLSEVADLDGLEQAPMVFQEEIAPKKDVRVTVVGDRVFAASPVDEIGHVDWRARSEPVEFERSDIPTRVEEMAIALVRRLGLVFGAIDLLCDAEGRYWFLEINPNGEWGWLQKKAKLPIAEAITETLIRP